MAVILRYFSEFAYLPGVLRKFTFAISSPEEFLFVFSSIISRLFLTPCTPNTSYGKGYLRSVFPYCGQAVIVYGTEIITLTIDIMHIIVSDDKEKRLSHEVAGS